MRFLEFSALAAGLVAAVPHEVQPYGAMTTSAPVTSATTTQYTTVTVFRVATTITATRNGTMATYESTSTETSPLAAATAPYRTGALYGYGNSTAVGTGALPSATYSGPASTGAAGKLNVQAFGLAAAVGVIGLLV
ncbi:uncharacterized protein MYCFIDRAFT_210058 [Pseudocercospora fijiensis CIRAD86]|uniref:Uncharacterized protein n=1 Tax=Pseudocercospora fijiensis (strain CIRAD86) TaxID=383855 RepID=N1QB98_PSEFD|nr:uncharacterized protein MYCFIDRAFT_210058 [Pseudocercospora fijiensis CIRAD86]EME89326.1 hypothetical protein MYCFIDRAFT_210058 [Pseudocercospora fijiensis CIRAD86]